MAVPDLERRYRPGGLRSLAAVFVRVPLWDGRLEGWNCVSRSGLIKALIGVY